jgi:hypothetical protein
MKSIRIIALIALLWLVGCGGASTDGSWSINMTVCKGTMSLVDDGGDLTGSWTCSGPSSAGGTLTLGGNLTGTETDRAVSLSMAAAGYQPLIMTGTWDGEDKITGSLSGSGMNGNAFTATR